MRWFSIVAAVVCLGWNGCAPLLSQTAESEASVRKADAFFAGIVVESSPEKIVVSRTVLGKTETRSFLVTPDTKIEGQLSPRSRVTVRYASDEETGDTAVLIVVRRVVSQSTKKK
jgi:hypothetical protein